MHTGIITIEGDQPAVIGSIVFGVITGNLGISGIALLISDCTKDFAITLEMFCFDKKMNVILIIM